MNYSHTQTSPLHLILHGVGFALLVAAWILHDRWPAAMLLAALGAVLIVVALMFSHLTVRDEGEFLAIRYGVLPVFRHGIRYRDITAVEPSRSSVIDGWGIHWIPGRGWTYNLWGFQCAKLTVAGRTVRVGTDDVDNLVNFLSGKIRQ